MNKAKPPQEDQGRVPELEAKILSLESAVVELKLNSESLQKKESDLLSLLRSMTDLVFVIGLRGRNRAVSHDKCQTKPCYGC